MASLEWALSKLPRAHESGLGRWIRRCLGFDSGMSVVCGALKVRSEPESMVCALNFLRQLSLNVIPEDRLTLVIRCFDHHISDHLEDRSDPVAVAQSFVVAHLRHSCGPLLAAQYGPDIADTQLVRIMAHRNLERLLGSASGTPLGKSVDPSELLEWYSRQQEVAAITGKPIGRLRGNLPSFWFTSTKEFERAMSTAVGELAETVRNVFGLGHYEDERLYAVTLPGSAAGVPKTPTVLDYPFGPYFFPVALPHRWGLTRVLPTLDIVGIREGVAIEADWPPEAELGFIGQVAPSTRCRPSEPEWANYVQYLWAELVVSDPSAERLLATIIEKR